MSDPLWITESDVVESLSARGDSGAEAGLLLEAAGSARNMAKTHQTWGGHHTLHAIGAVMEGAHPSAPRPGLTPRAARDAW